MNGGGLMELRRIAYFVAVARHEHFTRAAEEVGVAQPALSQQIRQLERELGVRLLDRTTRRVQLTDAGWAFLARAERLLADAARAQAEMQEFAGFLRGRVVIGALPSLEETWLPHVLMRFHRRYPGLEIALREETTAQLLELLERGRIDLAVVHEGGDVPRGLTITPLFTEDIVLVVAPEHPLAARERVALSALRDQPWILIKPGSVIRQVVLDAVAGAGFTPRIAFESAAVQPIRALAAAGLGVAFLPRSVAVAMGPPVAVVEIEPPTPTRTVALAWRAASSRPAVTSAFLSVARKAAASRSPQAGPGVPPGCLRPD